VDTVKVDMGWKWGKRAIPTLPDVRSRRNAARSKALVRGYPVRIISAESRLNRAQKMDFSAEGSGVVIGGGSRRGVQAHFLMARPGASSRKYVAGA
jgi:hypothetical protein